MNSEELIRVADELAARLEGPARAAFDLAVRWHLATAAIGLAVGIVISVFGAAGLVVLVWNRGRLDGFDVSLAAVLLSIPVVVGLVVSVYNVPGLLMPEYAALRGLLDQLR